MGGGQSRRRSRTAKYGPWTSVRANAIWLDTGSFVPSNAEKLNPAYGGAPQVDKPIAAFLRWYQLRGGYTPGPLYLLCIIAGLAGSVLAFMRRPRARAARLSALAGLFFLPTRVLVLGVYSLFES